LCKSIEPTTLPKWVFWSTRKSIDNEVPSITAILETIIAVPLYWWFAIHFETYLPLLVSVAVAPLVLLRSDESLALGVKWFSAWERSGWRASLASRREDPKALRRSFAAFGFLLGGITAYALSRNFLADVEGTAALRYAFAIGAISAAVVFAALLATWQRTIIGLSLAFVAIIMMAAITGKGAPNVSLATAAGAAVGGVPLGVFIVSLTIRVGATLRHFRAGLMSLPRNFRRLALCTSPRQEPELVPGLVPGETEFTIMEVLNRWRRRLDFVITGSFRRTFTSPNFINRAISSGAYFVIDLVAAPVWFIPGWIYRLTLKSTAWFWWPLAFLGGDLQRARDPDEFQRTTIGSLWAKTSIGLAIMTILTFVWLNFVVTGALFRDNPLLTVFGYFFVVNWSLRPWQLLPIALAVLSVAIVLWVDDASGQYRHAVAKGDSSLLSRADAKFRWIERMARFRLVLFLVFWLLVAVHALLYFNSLKCWTDVPSNVERWAQWVYGDRLPKVNCPEGPLRFSWQASATCTRDACLQERASSENDCHRRTCNGEAPWQIL
jgi:hypothetical protein